MILWLARTLRRRLRPMEMSESWIGQQVLDQREEYHSAPWHWPEHIGAGDDSQPRLIRKEEASCEH